MKQPYRLKFLATLCVVVCVALAVQAPGHAQDGGCPPGEVEVCRVPLGDGEMDCDVWGCTCTSETCSETTPGATAPAGTPRPTVVIPTLAPTPAPVMNLATYCVAFCPDPLETRPVTVRYRCLGTSPACAPVDARTGNCCEAPCSCEKPTDEVLPVTLNRSASSCSEYGASVRCSLPVWYADRLPFPRTMVTMEAGFWVSDANGRPVTQLPASECWSNKVDRSTDCACRANGSCDDDPPAVGTICDYQIGLKAEPAANAAPSWSCQEGGGGVGFQVSCLWQYSSAGKPYLGRGLDCEPLPAFSVTASVPYWWSFGRQWEQWEQVGSRGECQHWPGFGTAGCDLDGDGTNDPDTVYVDVPIYGWKHHGPTWQLLDLRRYGYPTPYMLNSRVQLAPYRPCGPHPVGVLYVPCIEVQGLISNPKGED